MTYSGMKALVMGLGLHGGGLASARFLAERGADVCVTDLRDEKTLAPSLEQLRPFPAIRYVLGRHEHADFENADFVVKNPGVPPSSPYLAKAKRIETDISLFLHFLHAFKKKGGQARLIAVTGSKGKSSTASALHWVLCKAREAGLFSGSAFLGGNITVSPLSFLNEAFTEDDIGVLHDVVLELSSWQLGDLKGRLDDEGKSLLKPRAAVLTAILPDHLDRYNSMEAYVADKRVIYQGQDADDLTVAENDEWGRSFLRETRARALPYADAPLPAGVAGGWLDGGRHAAFARAATDAEAVEIVGASPRVPGLHQKKNLLAAGLVLLDLGLPASFIASQLAAFPGIEHRLECFLEKDGVRFYNDSAATIPEAAAAAVDALSEGSSKKVVLLTGGTDKELDFAPLAVACNKTKKTVLLAGSGSVKLSALLDAAGIPYTGPFDALDKALAACAAAASSGDAVLLSPGCASFGMFQNEFDRGRKWKDAVKKLMAADGGDNGAQCGAKGVEGKKSPLKIPFAKPFIGKEEEEACLRVLRSGWLTTGRETQEFEREFAAFLAPQTQDADALQALAVNSATSGLHLALEACGVGQGDLVLVPSYTFTSTAEVVRYLGAEPVFVDVAEGTFHLDPSALEETLSRLVAGVPPYTARGGFGPVGKPKALIPVHYGGLPCDMDAIMEIARRYGLKVVEDAAHSFPSRVSKGAFAGSCAGGIGDAGVFSFYATKTITTGEGGMVVTKDPHIAARVAVMRSHGIDRTIWNRYTDVRASWHYAVTAPGFKYNIPDILSAIGRVQLERGMELLNMRKHIAARYDEAFSRPASLGRCVIPRTGDADARHLYPLRLLPPCQRDKFIETMQERGVGLSVHFIPLHTMPYYKERYGFDDADFPRSLEAFKREVSLPIYPGMTDEEVDYVIECALGAMDSASR